MMRVLLLMLLLPASVFADDVLRLRLEVSNPTADRVRGGQVAVRLPAPEVLSEARASSPMARHADDAGLYGLVDLPDVGPMGRAVVTVTVVVGQGEPAPPKGEAWRAPLSAEPEVADLARDLAGDRVAAIYRWVRANITDTGPSARDRGVAWALRARRGDCTEMAALVVAIARAAGLPARLVGGYRIEGSTLLDPGQYHNWAEVYDDGRWRLVDPQAGVLDKAAERYVPFERGPAPEGGPLAGRHRFKGHPAALTVRLVEAR